MQNSSDLTMVMVVAVAFTIGYLVVSFVLYVLKRGRENVAGGRQTSESKRHSGLFENGDSQSGSGTEKPRTDGEPRERNFGTPADRMTRDEAYFIGVLGLPRIFTKEELESSHRRLAAQYHPDKVNHLGPKLRETAEQEMKKINEAYIFLKSRYGL